MKKEEKKQLELLTWKYFCQQKIYEIGKVLSIIMLILIVPYLFGWIANILFVKTTNILLIGFDLIFYRWALGCLVVMILAICIVVICKIAEGIYNWIESNWQEAKKRAKQEMKNE